MATTKIKQRDITDCGAACLASVAEHYKLGIPVSRIRQYASTDKRGTNVQGLLEAAEKLNFQAKGVKGGFDSLAKIPKPAIAHIVVKEVLHHYVVIYKVTATHITVMDPAFGEMKKYTHEEFKKVWTGVLVLLLPNETFEAKTEKVSIMRRLWFLLKPHRGVMVQALVGAAIYTVIGLSTSIFLQKIIDYVIPTGNTSLLNLMAVVMLALLGLQLLIGGMKTVFMLKTGQQIDARLILGYYKHLLKLPQQFFDTMRVGEIISRINDAVKIRAFINDASINLAVNLFIVVFSFVLMFTYYWKLALIMLLIIPVYLVVYFIINRLNKKVQRKLMEQDAELESQLIESVDGMQTIKRFCVENYAHQKTKEKFNSLLKTIYKSEIINLISDTSTEFASRAFTIILLWLGAGFVIDEAITLGELLSFYALIGYFTGPVSDLIDMNQTVQGALIASDRLFEIMDLEREKEENMMTLKPEMLGDIMFTKVGFRYGSRVTVFEDFDLVIPHKKITAIIGESGSGKSTLAAILQKLYPLQAGHVKVGSYNLENISASSLRKLIGIVPQNIDLFAGNVIENIALGEYEPDMQRIHQILEQLGMMEFIDQLPNKLGSYLGENGVNLSGGQKQRIAIARALYKQPELLIMDEATSSLDSASEQFVQNTMLQFKAQGKTVLLIAHRLSTVVLADKIIILEKGKLIEEGTHSELLERNGHYKAMWQKQLPKGVTI
ncbi:MAG: peptidase domain-containing ABC transporter [Cyclobacteriaceae bacterium]|nr:peptidase domain-containing ABC transporter [Cyclobacteriaceae bacterium]